MYPEYTSGPGSSLRPRQPRFSITWNCYGRVSRLAQPLNEPGPRYGCSSSSARKASCVQSAKGGVMWEGGKASARFHVCCEGGKRWSHKPQNDYNASILRARRTGRARPADPRGAQRGNPGDYRERTALGRPFRRDPQAAGSEDGCKQRHHTRRQVLTIPARRSCEGVADGPWPFRAGSRCAAQCDCETRWSTEGNRDSPTRTAPMRVEIGQTRARLGSEWKPRRPSGQIPAQEL